MRWMRRRPLSQPVAAASVRAASESGALAMAFCISIWRMTSNMAATVPEVFAQIEASAGVQADSKWFDTR